MTTTLSAAGFQRIFNEEIVPTQLGSLVTRSRPAAMFIGAAPGSGVHFQTAAAKQTLTGSAPAVIKPTFLEPYHPRFVPPTPSGRDVAPDVRTAGRDWAQLAIDTVLQAGADAVIELRLDDPQMVAATMVRFREAGYDVGMSLRSVPHAVSRLGTFADFVHQLDLTGGGRLVSRDDHDAAYHGLLAVAELVEHDHLADLVMVDGWAGPIAVNYLPADGTWLRPETSTAHAVNVERSRSWSTQELKQFTELAQRLDRALDGRWHAEIREIVSAAPKVRAYSQAFPAVSAGFDARAIRPRQVQQAIPQQGPARHRR